MKNSAVVRLVCDQFNCDHRDVEVEFIASVGNRYEFKITAEDMKRNPIKGILFIQFDREE